MGDVNFFREPGAFPSLRRFTWADVRGDLVKGEMEEVTVARPLVGRGVGREVGQARERDCLGELIFPFFLKLLFEAKEGVRGSRLGCVFGGEEVPRNWEVVGGMVCFVVNLPLCEDARVHAYEVGPGEVDGGLVASAEEGDESRIID